MQELQVIKIDLEIKFWFYCIRKSTLLK
jgi:hypothetical protein